jgi:L-lactate dehydrogenase (cytochrome)
MRERDFRNGSTELIGGRVGPMLPFLPQFLARPRWLVRFLRDGGMMKFPNVVLPDSGPMAYADVGGSLAKSVVTWNDFAWIRKVWPRPMLIKGVHTGGDARRALDVGADGIVVSNHGGRQLDGVAATLHMLPEILDAVGGRTDVLMDGGVRRGSDVVKALCLGARAVLIGRAYAYGLAAAGHTGVARTIDILRTDMIRTMKLLGCASVGELTREFVSPGYEDPGAT